MNHSKPVRHFNRFPGNATRWARGLTVIGIAAWLRPQPCVLVTTATLAGLGWA